MSRCQKIDSELYRRLILRYQCDVFMTEITTAVHEYGVDRITSITSRTNKFKSIKSHALILQKYFIHFILHPKLFCLRLKSIFILIILYLLQGIKIFLLNPDRSFKAIKLLIFCLHFILLTHCFSATI